MNASEDMQNGRIIRDLTIINPFTGQVFAFSIEPAQKTEALLDAQ